MKGGVAMTHELTQQTILDNMFDRSMKIMTPTFETMLTQATDEDKENFNVFLQEAKQTWLDMMSQYLSPEEIDFLVQAFFYTSKIDEQKLLLFNTVYTQKAVELAETHLS